MGGTRCFRSRHGLQLFCSLLVKAELNESKSFAVPGCGIVQLPAPITGRLIGRLRADFNLSNAGLVS
jgi:hypothetical protein